MSRTYWCCRLFGMTTKFYSWVGNDFFAFLVPADFSVIGLHEATVSFSWIRFPPSVDKRVARADLTAPLPGDSCIPTSFLTSVRSQGLEFRLSAIPAAARRALGILVHEMVNGEPPFGYGGDDLTQRITAGLPRDTPPGPGEREDEDYRNVDEPKVLPIVRCGLACTHFIDGLYY